MIIDLLLVLVMLLLARRALRQPKTYHPSAPLPRIESTVPFGGRSRRLSTSLRPNRPV